MLNFATLVCKSCFEIFRLEWLTTVDNEHLLSFKRSVLNWLEEWTHWFLHRVLLSHTGSCCFCHKIVRVPVRTQLFSGSLALITNITNHFKKSGQWDEKRECKKQKLIQWLIPSPKLAMPKPEWSSESALLVTTVSCHQPSLTSLLSDCHFPHAAQYDLGSEISLMETQGTVI